MELIVEWIAVKELFPIHGSGPIHSIIQNIIDLTELYDRVYILEDPQKLEFSS